MNFPIDFILIIPCYNNLPGLKKSLASILYPIDSFQVLIVDDGSATPLQLSDFSDIGLNIHLIRHEENKGVVHALNTALQAIHRRTDFKYIARLDAGDICVSDRFTKQMAYLTKHPEIALLGSWCRFENDRGIGFSYRAKASHQDILAQMHFKCSFIHPTVMFRREILDEVGYYPANFPHAEDYAYFWEILKKKRGAILAEDLVIVTTSQNSVSSKNYKCQLRSRMKILLSYKENEFYLIAGFLLCSLRYVLPVEVIRFVKLRLLKKSKFNPAMMITDATN